MRIRHMLFLCAATVLLADAPLKDALGLSMDQAREVTALQAKYRPSYVAKRGEYLNQMRKLRRARIANDSAAVAREEPVARRLHDEMLGIQAKEDAEIRRLLTPEQNKKFDAHLELRRNMAGSSRDDKEFTGR